MPVRYGVAVEGQEAEEETAEGETEEVPEEDEDPSKTEL